MSEWVVPVTYELHGSVVVEAATAEEAKAKAFEALEFPATCDLINFEAGTPRLQA